MHISLEQCETNLVLTVCNKGIGIPAADINFLFRPFYRAGNVGKIPGTGLGLAIVKDAIERHGGTIAVQSAVGEGTTFTMSLPMVNALLVVSGRFIFQKLSLRWVTYPLIVLSTKPRSNSL